MYISKTSIPSIFLISNAPDGSNKLISFFLLNIYKLHFVRISSSMKVHLLKYLEKYGDFILRTVPYRLFA